MVSPIKFIRAEICENSVNQTVMNVLKSSVMQSLQSCTPGLKFQVSHLLAVCLWNIPQLFKTQDLHMLRGKSKSFFILYSSGLTALYS